jgi:hypothetical protein
MSRIPLPAAFIGRSYGLVYAYKGWIDHLSPHSGDGTDCGAGGLNHALFYVIGGFRAINFLGKRVGGKLYSSFSNA